MKREGVQAPEEITEDAKRWRLTFRGENGKSGTLTLPIPARMTAYAADIHDKENIRARSPRLYKEWRFEGVARGDGIFREGFTAPARYTLVFQARGTPGDRGRSLGIGAASVPKTRSSFCGRRPQDVNG